MDIVKKLARLWLLAVCFLSAAVLVWQATRWVYLDTLEKLATTSGERLTLYEGTLREALSRYAFLPYVLAQNPDVQVLLSSKTGVDKVNRYLEKLNAEAGAEAFFVMDTAGDTLAASNWRDELTYVGHNYRFRPYFTETQQGRKGRFFAIGATTGRPGYFFSHPVVSAGQNVGAAMVKVNLRPLQDGWHNGGETVLVSDANGVVFLASFPDWIYQTLTPLSHAQLERIRSGKQYGDKDLTQLPVKTLEEVGEGLSVVRFGRKPYLMLSRPVVGLGWDMHHLVSLQPARKQARLVAINGTIMALLVLALGLYGRERKLKEISRRQARQAEAFREMNVRLQEEIVEHNRTERVLRETQDELIQAGKLAALGHMAAGIVHELNQPISAIRTYVASCRLLLERQETEKLEASLTAIKRTTEHMGTITRQLKSFAHKAPQKLEPIIIQDSLREVLTMTAALIKKHAIVLETDIVEAPLIVSCQRGWIAQVLLNLIRNAIDAMDAVTDRRLAITVKKVNGQAEISVSDNGTGIADHISKELFIPFVTTKAVGDGLGLGLSICNRIVADLGGTIRAENNVAGGARFVVTLPLAENQQEKTDE